ncbi:MAG TPA: SH3 domain-containing protein [Candidatus Acidoferrum sp.]
MKSSTKYFFGAFILLLPALARAQHLAQVTCARQGDYTYLYSSITTMEVIRTLQCGEQLEVTGRYQGFFGVRTTNGETGYIGEGSLVLLKDKPGPKAPAPATPQIARPRTAYDPAAPPAPPANPIPAGFDLTLPNNTPIHLKLGKTISSQTAHVGDAVDLVVVEDVVVDGLCIISSGASAEAAVSEAEPKKRLGKGGKLGLSVKFVHLADNEKAAARSFDESIGSNSTAGSILPLAHGKEVVIAQGTEITAYIDGDMYLKRASFQSAKSATSPAGAAANPQQPHRH